VEKVGGAGELGEERRVGAGHPDLASKRREPLEQAAAAARIEMGRDLVEEHQRRKPAHRGDEARLGEDEPDEERLLLAGRGERGGHVFRPVPHRKIGGLRPDEGPPGGAVAGAAVAQHRAVAVLRVDGRMGGDEVVELARQRDHREREWRGVVARGDDQGGEALDGLVAGERNGDAELRHLALDRLEPAAVGGIGLKHAVARAQGSLERGDARAVLRVDREDEPVEETAALAGRAAEEPVELWG
jgi:hypothetical protein